MLRTRLTAGRPCREGQVAGLPSTRVRCSGRHIVNDDPPQGEMPIGSHLCLIKKKCDLQVAGPEVRRRRDVVLITGLMRTLMHLACIYINQLA